MGGAQRERPDAVDELDWSTYEANLEKIVESAIAPRRAANPDVKVDYEVVRSEPVRALVDRTEGAALLVVGSRGSGGFPGLHVGSTALRLISRCHCPLLMTR